MIPVFSVTEARVAITCPRILYFDQVRARENPQRTKRVTQIWVDAEGGISGCGKLFHDTVEKLNRLAVNDRTIASALESAVKISSDSLRKLHVRQELMRFAVTCVNREVLSTKSPEQVMALNVAVETYLDEVAEIISFALGKGCAVAEIVVSLFGDSRKRVDVSVRVGKDGEPVRVRGAIDYIYFDYFRKQRRIIDYKLMPSAEPSHDLLQVSLYALMHHQQHQTSPDAGVLYLYPRRDMVGQTWEQLYARRYVVYDLMASMAEWVKYDERSGEGMKPPGEPSACRYCPWKKVCEARLGPKLEGSRCHHWTDQALAQMAADPVVETASSPEPQPIEEYIDAEDEAAIEEESSEFLRPKMEPAQQAATSVKAPDPSERRDSPSPTTPESGLWIGATTSSRRPVFLSPSALPTHLAVMGAAGSGKTWLAKVLAEEAIRQGVPVLAVDPQGDLVQFLHRSELPADASEEDRRAHAHFRQVVEPRIWTPGSSHARRLSLSPIRLPGEEELAGIPDPQRRHEEWQAMLGVVAGNLVELAGAGGDSELQATFMLEVLRALTRQNDFRREPLGLSQIAAGVLAPEEAGIEDPEQFISKAQRERLGRRLLARIKGPSANLFSGGTLLDIGQMCEPSRSGKAPLNVIYLNALNDDDQKQSFVAALAAEIYRWMITTASTGATRLLFYLDEAKDYLPAGTRKPPAKPPLLRLFAQGRKYGVSCLICTQSPRSVDYNIFSNASTKLIGRLEASQDVERVAEWFGSSGGTPDWLAGRKGAAKGTWVGRWPDMPKELEGAVFKSRLLFSRHEGAWSPDKVERENAEAAEAPAREPVRS